MPDPLASITKSGAQWEIISPGTISLVATKLEIVLTPDGAYHIHHDNACFGYCDRLIRAKHAALLICDELMQMGIEP